MTATPIQPDELRRVRLLLLDVDGVLTDGRLYFGADGKAAKCFHVRDGLGIALLLQAGVEIGLISGRDDASVRARARELKIGILLLGERGKAEAVARLLAEKDIAPADVVYLADDVNDLAALEQVGIPIAVADAHPSVLAAVRFVTRERGGRGAVREVADAILAARGSSSDVNLEEVTQ